MFAFGFAANALPAALLRAADSFGTPFTTLARVSALQFAAFFLAAVGGGLLADRYGKQRILESGCLLLAGGGLAWSAARGLPAAALGSTLLGLGGGILESMGCAVLTDAYPRRRRLLLNVSQIFFCLGAISGPALMGLLLPRGVDWRWFFGGVAAVGLALLWLYAPVRLPPPGSEERIDRHALRALAGRARFWIPCAVIFGYVLCESGVGLFLNAYLRTAAGAPEDWAIYAVAAFWAAMALGRLLCAALPEHLDGGRIVTLLLLAAAAVLAALPLCRGWQSAFALLTLTGFVFAGTWPLIVGLATAWNPRYSGTVVGVTVAVGSLGCIAAPLALAPAFQRLPPVTVFPLSALALLAGAAVLAPACFRPAAPPPPGAPRPPPEPPPRA